MYLHINAVEWSQIPCTLKHTNTLDSDTNTKCSSTGAVLTEVSEAVILCLLEVKWGAADLIALQRWSHEDHRPHRGHHVVGRDVFLPEIGDDEGRGTKNRESRGKK